jgi:hypothetical protein
MMGASDNLQPQQFNLHYVRRKGKAPDFGEQYGQHIEPHGRYLGQANPGFNYDKDLFETGDVSFKNPLHIEYGGGWQEESNWKHQLSKRFGATGRDLSDKIVAAGHDAVIAHDKHGIQEVVDLTGLKPRRR